MKHIGVAILTGAVVLGVTLSGDVRSDTKGVAERKSALQTSQYLYDYTPPNSISSSAPTGRIQIAELDTSFPSQGPSIELWRKEMFENNAVVRSHSWSIWGGITSLTAYAIDNPFGADIGATKLPAFMTWYSSYEVYGANSQANNRCTKNQPATVDKHGIKRCKSGSVLDFNKFTLVEAKYVIDKKLNNLATLTSRVKKNPTALDLPPFNASKFKNNKTDNISISLKPVYYLLKNNAHNLLPYWGGMQANTTSNVKSPTPNTWKQCVLVTVGSPTANAPKVCNPGKGNANVVAPKGGWQKVALSDFLAVPLTQAMLDELLYAKENSTLQASSIISLGYSDDAKPHVGDVAVLVGMHITVRETKDWVWQTMYWSPGNLTQVSMDTGYPEFPPKQAAYTAGPNYPGSSFDNPFKVASKSDATIPGWAKNYAMCTAYSTVYPVQPDSGGSNANAFPQICYNPWLETAFDTLQGHFSDSGLNSNCMSCHGQASYNGAVSSDRVTAKCALPQGFGYYGNGYVARDNSCLTNKNFAYDFSWHIGNAYAPTPKAANPDVLHQKPPLVAPSFSQ